MRLTRPKTRPALNGPVGIKVAARRQALLRAARRHGVQVQGVFGSVARGEDTPDSDLDLLVELPPSMGLFGVGRLQAELEALVGTRVDLVAEADLKPGVRDAVLADLVTL
jgi:predicted nucleotidyltransferase